MALSRDELIAAIHSELSRATDYSNASLKETRAKAWNYYLNRPRGDEVAGRSTVQDTTVRDVTHALMAAIMPAYSTDHLISFEAVGPGDVDQAEAESSAVNNLFTETNKGYTQLSAAVQDALLFRNGIIKVWVEDKIEITSRSFRAPAADVLARVGPDDGEWEHTGTEDGLSSFQVTKQAQHLRTDSIEPAMVYLDPNQEDQDISEAAFIAELTYFTRSDLRAMGISAKVVDSLPATPDKSTLDQGGQSNVDILAKFIDGRTDIGGAATSDRDEIQCNWVHMEIDRDGDGISEKWRFLVSNRQLLMDEMVDFFPYCSGSGWPVPHRWSGLGVYDLNSITQDNRTNALRQLNDNLNVANNQRPVFDPGETDAEDIANGAPGRGIRSRNPANVGWMPSQDITSNSISFLQYMDGVRANQTGASLDMQGGDAQTMASISGLSAEMQLAPRELMAAHLARNIAETLVRNLFLLIHRTLRTSWDAPIMFNKAGDWQQTDPSEWQPRNRLNVNVGLSPGERRRNQAALQFVMQMQMQMIQGGTANITTNWNGVHSAISDWMKAAGLDGHEGYFLDPDGQESQAGQQAAQQQAQQQQQKADQMEQLQLQMMQMQAQIEKGKIDEDARQHDTELKFKYFDALLDADTEDAKLEANKAADSGAAEPAG